MAAEMTGGGQDVPVEEEVDVAKRTVGELAVAEPKDEVERIYLELKMVGELLEKHGSMSDQVSFNELAAKTVVLSAASFFEDEIVQLILNVSQETGSRKTFREFKYNQGLSRKYHSLFSWEADNANRFFALFGPSARDWLVQKAKDDELREAIKEFMFLGRRRNEIVHSNFAATGAGITFEEAFETYRKAKAFVEWLPTALKEVTHHIEEADSVV